MNQSKPRPLTADAFIGRSVDGLPLADRLQLAGHWIASELYSPERLPLRIIAAVGESARDCVEQLRKHGQDPIQYHYELLGEPFEPDASPGNLA